MKTLTRIIAVFLMVLTVFSGITFGELSQVQAATKYKRDDVVTFGSYPQSRVTNSTTLKNLNKMKLKWISYKFCSGNGEYGKFTKGDFMKYADVEYKGTKYRAVKFTSYRPGCLYDKRTAANSNQDENGYVRNTVYWFKYEPLKWRILDAEKGLALCEAYVDCPEYINTTKGKHTYFDSNFRKWSNSTFLNTAFNKTEQSALKTRTIKSGKRTLKEKVTLLSTNDLTQEKYGFNAYGMTPDHVCSATDYTKCLGVYEGGWSVRVASEEKLDDYSSCCAVFSDGELGYGDMVSYRIQEMRPAIIFNLSSSAFNKNATLSISTVKSVRYSSTASTITFKWNKVNNAAGYKVYMSRAGTNAYKLVKTTKSTKYVAEKLKYDTIYKIRIVPYLKGTADKVNYKAATDIFVATNCKASAFKLKAAGNGEVKITSKLLNTKYPMDENNYECDVYVSSTKDGKYKKHELGVVIFNGANSDNTPVKTVTFTLDGLKKGKTYYIKTRMKNTVSYGVTMYSVMSQPQAITVK